MNDYPQQYYTYYYPSQYQTMQWQGILGTIMGVAVLVAMAAWAFSLVRKSFRGEEVGFPL
jgi:hypothetical protein